MTDFYYNSNIMRIGTNGYPVFKDSGKFVHRWVAEKYTLGRKLASNEEVHHVNGDKLNFDPSNLVILSSEDHKKIENEARKQRNLNIGYLLLISMTFLSLIISIVFDKALYVWVGILILIVGANLHEYPILLRGLLFRLKILHTHSQQQLTL